MVVPQYMNTQYDGNYESVYKEGGGGGGGGGL